MSDPTDPGFAVAVTSHLQTRWLGKPLHFFALLDSTNTYAAHLARAGAPEGSAVIADEQSGGKGRLGRSWVSPPGVNLYLSVILRPTVPVATIPQISLLAAVAVADTLAQQGFTPTIKWPNDVLIKGKKICGILAEMHTEAARVRAVILGIGVNINTPVDAFPAALRDKASSLLVIGGHAIDRAACTTALLTHLEQWYVLWLEQGFPVLRPAWEQYAAGLIGTQVTVAGPEGTITGIMQGLDVDGALVLQGESGTRCRLLTGDVTVVGGYGHGEDHDSRH